MVASKPDQNLAFFLVLLVFPPSAGAQRPGWSSTGAFSRQHQKKLEVSLSALISPHPSLHAVIWCFFTQLTQIFILKCGRSMFFPWLHPQIEQGGLEQRAMVEDTQRLSPRWWHRESPGPGSPCTREVLGCPAHGDNWEHWGRGG